MLDADPLLSRPHLVNAATLARALDSLRPRAHSSAEVWRLLTERYIVDLDAVAALLPSEDPETSWLASRD